MTYQWRVVKLDRNWRRVIRETFVRASSEQQAKRIGRAVMGPGGVAQAMPYDPSRDPVMAGFVREVTT
jgi:hypothetical protein